MSPGLRKAVSSLKFCLNYFPFVASESTDLRKRIVIILPPGSELFRWPLVAESSISVTLLLSSSRIVSGCTGGRDRIQSIKVKNPVHQPTPVLILSLTPTSTLTCVSTSTSSHFPKSSPNPCRRTIKITQTWKKRHTRTGKDSGPLGVLCPPKHAMNRLDTCGTEVKIGSYRLVHDTPLQSRFIARDWSRKLQSSHT